MNEQTIILIFLVMALGITLWLYILKAIPCLFLGRRNIFKNVFIFNF